MEIHSSFCSALFGNYSTVKIYILAHFTEIGARSRTNLHICLGFWLQRVAAAAGGSAVLREYS